MTAAVDAIHLHKRLAIDADMTAAGSVVWTGSSSMDIRMELLQARGMAPLVPARLLSLPCSACVQKQALPCWPTAPRVGRLSPRPSHMQLPYLFRDLVVEGGCLHLHSAVPRQSKGVMCCVVVLQGEGDTKNVEPSLVALFTFVARDPVTGRAMPVNRLAPTTDLERARFADRQDVADKRRAARRAGSESRSPEGKVCPCLALLMQV